jgi:CHAT domain-containing protein
MLANKRERRIASIDMGAPPVGPKKTPIEQMQLIAMADTGGETGIRGVSVQAKLGEEAIEETVISPVNADPPSIDEIKSLVANRKSSCVEFLMSGDKIYTWVIHPDGNINMAPPIAVPDDFHNRVQALVRGMTKSGKTPAENNALGMQRQRELRAFYDMLIKPIEQYLPKNKDEVITVVPHDILFSIPFAALMAENGDYWVERHTLSYAPAIGVLRATQKLRAEAEQMPHKLVAFGNQITEKIAFLGALPYAEKEVKHIASLYPPASTQIEIGAAATKDKFTELVPTASELHLATHGLVDEEHPMKSAVVLAPTDKDDGLLSVRDILTLKNLRARIVVLSACQTGRGKITGDGVVGLSRAFIIAGAPSVLVSQWNVDDILTDYQMEKFYRFYLKGTDRARALRDAQLATIHHLEGDGTATPVAHTAEKLRANPRYWAAFQLIGEI